MSAAAATPPDWSRPWLAALRAPGEAVARAVASGTRAAVALERVRDVDAPHFVAADAAGDEPYEAFIARTGQVPTRDNLHDLFNGLVWLRWGPLKRRLNRLHAAAIARTGVGATRGPLRDALTLFDESGALLQAPPALVEALHRRDWTGLFVTRRALWAQARFQIVGHALLEQLSVAPRKGITAHVLVNREPLALSADDWAAKPFLPLPVLGLPGWWPANEDPTFYADAGVFRPPGLKRGAAP